MQTTLMKVFVWPLALLVIFCPLSAQGQDAEQTSRSPEEAAVHKVVDEIVAAEDRNHADALDRLYVPEYTFVTPAGQIWTKAHYLGLMRSGDLKSGSYSRDEETIRIYGNIAI